MLLCSPEEPYVLRLSHLGSLIFDSWKDPIFMQVEILFVTSIEIASFCMPSFDTLFFFFFLTCLLSNAVLRKSRMGLLKKLNSYELLLSVLTDKSWNATLDIKLHLVSLSFVITFVLL